jgi:hypothetical protein
MRPVHRADNLTTERLDNAESLTSHNPMGLQGLGIALLFTYAFIVASMHTTCLAHL